MNQPAFAPPPAANAILRRLQDCGHEAWLVGGCVRDSLLGIPPKDWDICTSATPAEMSGAFAGWKTIPTGLRHGTVTVRLEGQGWEVTSYRVEEGYTDHRRPDAVRFVRELEADLARRDFTVNAMAWHPDRGLRDPFGGAADLRGRVLRCVGEPDRRFEEDALRILRGVRFAARYGLLPHPDTAAAIHRRRDTLRRVAPERCCAELRRLLCAPGESLAPVLTAFWDVLTVLPGLAPLGEMPGYDQQNPHHHLDLQGHTIQAVVSVPPEEGLRFAALLHDAGKPGCRTVDQDGVAHFYGHGKASAQLAEKALRALRCENALRRRVVELVELHDAWVPPTPAAARRWLGRLGPEAFFQLLEVKRADGMGQARELVKDRLAELDKIREMAEEAVAQGQCLTLRDLAVNGRDVMAAGIAPGPEVGRVLGGLLEGVLSGELPNQREALLEQIGAIE